MISAAHHLPLTPEGHPCRHPHGHNYEIQIVLVGGDNERGWLMDFYDLDALVEPILKEIDHKNLNDVEGLANPTAEIISRWLFNKIHGALKKTPQNPRLKLVRVWETPSCWAEFSV